MDDVRRIADAVLYEGYILWPYRRSALKNRGRWTFGGVFPPAWAAAHPDDPAEARAQVLVAGDGAVDVRVRFLHAVERRVRAADGFVDELVVEGERHLSWQEAVERELAPGPIEVAGGAEEEPLADGAAIVRSWEGLRGAVEVETEPLGDTLRRVTVRVANATPWNGDDREDALRRTFCSAHVALHAPDATFVSAQDPPAEAPACANVGLWPVLVGDEHTMLAAPIILGDYPQIAPESPGDLFDATEIDQLLILNVLALTPEEQDEMRATDPRAREILERCAALTPGQRQALYGVMR